MVLEYRRGLVGRGPEPLAKKEFLRLETPLVQKYGFIKVQGQDPEAERAAWGL